MRLNDAAYLRQLQRRLVLGGCVVERVAADTLRVLHTQAVDEDEEHLELQFFLRAWQLENPAVQAELIR